MLMHGVLDGQRVQPEFLAQDREVGPVRIMQVEPDDRGVFFQVLADVSDREALGYQRAVPVQARAGLALGGGGLADGSGGRRDRVVAAEGHPASGTHVIYLAGGSGRTIRQRTPYQE